jgi:hypothetical protein
VVELPLGLLDFLWLYHKFFFGDLKLIIAIVGSNVASKDDQTSNT